MSVVDLKIVQQAGLKVVGRIVITALEKPPRQDAKPQLHLIQPGAMLRRKVKDMFMGRITQERASLDTSTLQGSWEQMGEHTTLSTGDTRPSSSGYSSSASRLSPTV